MACLLNLRVGPLLRYLLTRSRTLNTRQNANTVAVSGNKATWIAVQELPLAWRTTDLFCAAIEHAYLCFSTWQSLEHLAGAKAKKPRITNLASFQNSENLAEEPVIYQVCQTCPEYRLCQCPKNTTFSIPGRSGLSDLL